MNLSNRVSIALAVVLLIIVAGAAYFFSQSLSGTPSPTPAASSTPPTITVTPITATTSPAAPAKATTSNPLPVDPADHLSSWSLGTASSAAISQANSNMVSLEAQVGKGVYANYDLYVGIGEDYELMGNGQDAYDYFIKAEETDLARGLAYEDIGNLMAELGAYNTAREAFQKALAAETNEPFELAYVQFLATYTPKAAGVEAAFTTALEKFPNDAAITSEEAQWQTATGQTSLAILTWQRLLPLVATSSQSAIQAEITRLKAEQ